MDLQDFAYGAASGLAFWVLWSVVRKLRVWVRKVNMATEHVNSDFYGNSALRCAHSDLRSELRHAVSELRFKVARVESQVPGANNAKNTRSVK